MPQKGLCKREGKSDLHYSLVWCKAMKISLSEKKSLILSKDDFSLLDSVQKHFRPLSFEFWQEIQDLKASYWSKGLVA